MDEGLIIRLVLSFQSKFKTTIRLENIEQPGE